jgi:hypothetical protein
MKSLLSLEDYFKFEVLFLLYLAFTRFEKSGVQNCELGQGTTSEKTNPITEALFRRKRRTH